MNTDDMDRGIETSHGEQSEFQRVAQLSFSSGERHLLAGKVFLTAKLRQRRIEKWQMTLSIY